MRYYFEAFKKYALFSGRSTRSEYWFFFLFNLFAALIIGVISGFIGAMLGLDRETATGLADLYFLAVLVPSIAISVRRLHDIGFSGLWVLLSFVPFLGGIALLVMYCSDSQPGPNRFGPNPKGVNPLALEAVQVKQPT
jgi:uncharacterized membrane protein YhaH (DUF805 family)